MQIIYNNFDGLDIAFKGAFPQEILDQLAQAREQAQQERGDVYLALGSAKIAVMVAETGAKGGYRYRFNTGKDGETWFVVHSTNSDKWNIRVSISSLGLALGGYEAVISGIINRLIALGAIGKKRFVTASGKAVYIPQESISRFDYCYDFIMDSAFQPLPQDFIAHQRTKKHVYKEKELIDAYSASNGDIFNTIRIGQMPNKQVVLYNKTKEITHHSKEYWWEIWRLKKEDILKGNQAVWRVELRAGKNELNAWGLKTFDDFENKAGDITMHILKQIRYTTPLSTDSNRSRWPNHPLWEECLKVSINSSLGNFTSYASRENILKGFKDNYIKEGKKRLIGNAIPLGALLGDGLEIVPRIFESLANDFKNNPPKDSLRKFEKAKDRFQSLK